MLMALTCLTPLGHQHLQKVSPKRAIHPASRIITGERKESGKRVTLVSQGKEQLVAA